MGLYKQDGMYHGSVTVSGIRFRKALGVRTLREAEKKLEEFRKEASEGLIVIKPTTLQRRTFGEVVDQWLDERRRGVGRLDKSPLSPQTLKCESERAVVVRRKLGHIKVMFMQPAALEEYIAQRKREGVSNGTINRELDVIRGTLKKADRRQLATMCRNLSPGESIGRAFSPEEKARLMAAASRTPGRRTARLALILALNTSMRPIEMKSLKWRDCDLSGDPPAIALRISKTKAGRRPIPLNDAAIEVLEELARAAAIIAGEYRDPESFVFFGGNDVYQQTGSWRTAWRAILKEAGIAKCRFYDSRHTAVTELLQDPNTSEETVRAIVGHVSQKMLQRYSHQRMGPKHAAVQSPTFGTQSLTIPVNVAEGHEKKPN